MAKLREPLDSLEGLEGLGSDMTRKCAVTIRAEEAIALVPEILKREWSEGALQKWSEQAMKEDFLDSTGKARARRLARMRAKAPSAATHGKKPQVQPGDPTKEAFALLENWVKIMRPLAPMDQLQETIIGLVHGPDAELPGLPEPVGAEVRRLVPKPGQLAEGSRWVFIEELEAALDLENQFNMSCVMHAEIPVEVRRRCRPSSAGAVLNRGRDRDPGGRLPMSFPRAYKNMGGGGMRITASEMQPWSAGQMPRSPRTCEVPGPGFYVDRSLQRAVSNPVNGEFAPAGKPRTCCAVPSLSITSRFGQVDLSRVTTLKRPSSAPCLGGGKGKGADSRTRANGHAASDTRWGRLLTV